MKRILLLGVFAFALSAGAACAVGLASSPDSEKVAVFDDLKTVEQANQLDDFIEFRINPVMEDFEFSVISEDTWLAAPMELKSTLFSANLVSKTCAPLMLERIRDGNRFGIIKFVTEHGYTTPQEIWEYLNIQKYYCWNLAVKNTTK